MKAAAKPITLLDSRYAQCLHRDGAPVIEFATDLYKPDGPADILPVFLQVTCIHCILATSAVSAGQGVLEYCWEYFSPLL